MSDTKATHTPGPWKVWMPDGIFVLADGRDICLMTPTTNDFHDGNDEDEANARLIAAAPDMLAALKAFAEPGQPVSAHVIEMARAAIAKAEGRTNG